MPRASEAPAENQVVKLLLIGDGKGGKTFYAGLAAEQGFNVLYLDGDVAAPTIQQLPPKAKENIYLLPVGDRSNPTLSHDYIDFMVKFTSESKLIWDDTNMRTADRKTDLSDSEVWTIHPGRLDHNWILVIDSWTSLVQSCMLWAAREHGVDLADTNSAQMRNVYSSSGMKLTQILVIIQRIKCNVICIAHPDEYVKQKRPEGQKMGSIAEKDMVVEWTKMIPKSSSKPHAMTMAKFFTDVAWMTSNPSGTERQLDFRLDPSKISGGHFNEKKAIDAYSFANLVKAIGGFVPAVNAPIDSVIEIAPRGTYEAPAPAAKLTLNGGAKDSTPAKVEVAASGGSKGFAALIGNKAK
jgi:hypothetical protein